MTPAIGELVMDTTLGQLCLGDGVTAGGIKLPYKEVGNWTPVLTLGGATTGITYTTQSGKYHREGDLVTVWCDMVLSSKGSATGSAAITGLPFANGLGINAYEYAQPDALASFTGYQLGVLMQNGATSVLPRKNKDGADSQITDTNFNNTSVIRFRIEYRV